MTPSKAMLFKFKKTNTLRFSTILMFAVFQHGSYVAASAKADVPSTEGASLSSCNAIREQDTRLKCLHSLLQRCLEHTENDMIAACLRSLADVPQGESTKMVDKGKTPPHEQEMESFGLKQTEQHLVEEITSRVVKIEHKKKNIRVLFLENGQIWKQSASGRFPIKTGQQVSISRGALGSFNLRREGSNRKIKVKRVN